MKLYFHFLFVLFAISVRLCGSWMLVTVLTQTAMSLNTISLKTFLFSLPVKNVPLALGWSWVLLIDLEPSFTKASSESSLTLA